MTKSFRSSSGAVREQSKIKSRLVQEQFRSSSGAVQKQKNKKQAGAELSQTQNEFGLFKLDWFSQLSMFFLI